jgi:redox-sensitive bicupin YhaK (pirin superfamily)
MSTVKLNVHKSGDRGHADHDWLKTYHHFSFANYFNPDLQNFGALREFFGLPTSHRIQVPLLTHPSSYIGVINEDRVAGAEGFGTHPHREFEIFSYIVDGELKRKYQDVGLSPLLIVALD